MRLRGFLSIASTMAAIMVFSGAPAALAEPLEADALTETTTPEPEKNETIAQAVERFQRRDFDGAADLLKKAAAENTDLPPAGVMMAQLFARANQGAAIRQSLERAVNENPQDPEAYVIMGDLALRGGRVTDAQLLFQKADQLLAGFNQSQKRKEALVARTQAGQAAVAEARGDWAAAQKHLEAWLKIDPENAVAMQRMARAMFQQKKPADALDFLRKAKDANDDVLTPEAQLARFYHEFGDQKNAQIWMNQALKKAPKDVRTHLVAAQWFLESGQLDKAAQEAATAMKLDPKSLEAQIFRGVVALFQKDFKSAETYFQQAHVQSPSNFAASNNLALALAEQDDSLKQRRALEYAQANVRQHQRSAEALSTYGWVLYKLGQVDEAERALRAAAGAGRLAPDTAYYMAVVANAKGRKDEAVQLLQAATKADGPFANRNEAQELLKQLQS